MNTHPLTFHISKESWQFFATMTFKDDKSVGGRVPSIAKQYKAAHAFLRLTARRFAHGESRKSRIESLLWVLRHEYGELTGRPHFHALLGGIPAGYVNTTSRFWLKHQWSQIVRAGNLDVRRYEYTLGGVSYCLKKLEEDLSGYSYEAANAYEVARFKGQDSEVSISRSCLRKWARQRRNDGLRQARTKGTTTRPKLS